jgi:hypothetical protein
MARAALAGVWWCVWLLSRGACAVPPADGAGGALHFNGRAPPHANRVNVWSKVHPAGTFARGVSVSFWAKANVPATLMSNQQKLPGTGGGYFGLWPVLLDETPLTPWVCASDYNVAMVSVQTEGFQPQDSRAGALVRNASAYQDWSEEELWVHLTISWDAVGNEVVVWTNAGSATEQKFNTSEPSQWTEEGQAALLRAGAISRAGESSIVLGQAYHNDFDLNAELDDWCVFTRGLSQGEAARVATEGCFAAFEGHPDLVMHYGFDDPAAPLWDSVSGVVTGSVGSRVRASGAFGTELDMFLGGKGGGFPRPVVSSAPMAAGKVRVVRDGASRTPVVLRLRCALAAGCAGWRLAVLPARGRVCSGVAAADRYWSVASNGCPGALYEVDRSVVLGSSANPGVGSRTTADQRLELDALFYVPDGAANESDSFEWDVLFANATTSRAEVLVLTNTPPAVRDSFMTLREGTGSKLVLPSETFMLSDREQAPNTCLIQVTRVELNVAAYPGGLLDVSYDRALSNATVDAGWDETLAYNPAWRLEQQRNISLNMTSPARVLWLNHSGDVGGPAMLSVFWRAFDGLSWSQEARVTVDVLMSNKCPVAEEVSTEGLHEDGMLLVDLEGALTDREGDMTFVKIEAFPQHAAVFQANSLNSSWSDSDNDNGFGQRVLGQDMAVAETQQWVAATATSMSASSVWDVTNAVTNLIGEPDHYPDAGDSTLDWQPATMGEHIWVQVTFATPVFPTELALFETWSPGSAYLIEAADFDQPGRWVELWSGANLQASFCPTLPKSAFCAGVVRYAFCPRGVRTNLVKVHFRPDSPDRWVAVDSMRLSGTLRLPGNALFQGGKKIWIRPDKDFHGLDELRFAVFDCPYFDLFGSLHGPQTRHARLAIDVAPVDDPPVVRAARGAPSAVLLAPGIATTLEIELQDVDGLLAANHSLFMTLLAEAGEPAAIVAVNGTALTTQTMQLPAHAWLQNNTGATSTTLLVDITPGRCASLQDAELKIRVELQQQDTQRAQETFTVTLACSALPTVLRREHSDTLVPFGLLLCCCCGGLALLASAWLARRATTRTVKRKDRWRRRYRSRLKMSMAH